MAKILFCWELGGSLGHVTPIRAFALELLRRGHRVLVAVRDVHAAQQVFARDGIPFVAAPYKSGKRVRPIAQPRFFGHILHNNGWGDPNELTALAAAWRNLYAAVQPDVILFNHSPTALLAARGWPARRALLGDGFCSPPATVPLPIIRPWKAHDVPRLARDDELITAVANRAVAAIGGPPMAHLADIYREVDENFLLTFAEIDHFGARPAARYRGIFNTCPGDPPQWPEGNGQRVFAYLKPQETLPQLLPLLDELGCALVVHGTWVRDFLRRGPAFRHIRLAAEPVNLERAARECDAAVLNATHGSTAAFLLAGKPIVQLPIVVEQVLNARSTQRLGAGLIARRDQPQEICRRLVQLLNEKEFTSGAIRFASAHRGWDASAELAETVATIELLGKVRGE